MRINHGGMAGLAALMIADNTLQVFDEAPLVGRVGPAFRSAMSHAGRVGPQRVRMRGAPGGRNMALTGPLLSLPEEDDANPRR